MEIITSLHIDNMVTSFSFLLSLCSVCSFSLLILVASIVTAISANQTVTSPAPVSFNCTVDSYPPSNITWLHNGAEVRAAPPRVTISTVQVDNRTQESTLTLLNTTSEDTGTYTCSAVNDEGLTFMTTGLLVLGELVLLHLPCIGPMYFLSFLLFAQLLPRQPS